MKGGLAVVALAVAMAGCLHGPAAPPGLPVDEHGKSLPTLHGIVVDEAIRPLVGVEVRFLGTTISATTDVDGHYEIRRPTHQAEDVLVTAFKAGYNPRTQQASVSGHRSTRVDFGLEPDRYAVPHVDVLEFRGSVGCQAAVGLGSQGQRIVCNVPENDDDRDKPKPWRWDLNPTPGFSGAVVEVHWQAESAATQTLHAWLTAPMAGGQGGELQAEATGPNPLRLEIPADAARSFNRWESVRVVVEVPQDAQGPAGVAASINQAFEAFASLFYVDAAPEGYALG